MKPGDEIKCPHCNADAFLVKKTLMDGWTKTGEILSCSACSQKIADMPDKGVETAQKSKSVSKLAAFLDTEQEKKPELHASSDEKCFCRDCEYFISHPFLSRCDLHNRDVEPMNDCPSFKPKKKEKETA